MKVLVTGGSGFVGAHTVVAVRAAGHSVRLLARSRSRLAAALSPLGVRADDVEVVEGDCLRRADVRAAVQGCDAVVHAAAVFTLDPRRQGELVDRNVAMTRHVLDAAVDGGLDPVVHVSSYVALLPSAQPLQPDAPAGPVRRGYGGSKAASEEVARRHQAAGAPVVTTYPGAVIGPHDPNLGESDALVLMLARSGRPPAFGRIPLVDVRDLATVHARALTPGLGARRLLVTGHDMPMVELAQRVAAAAGRRSRPVRLSPTAARSVGLLTGLAGRAGVPVPIGPEPIRFALGYPGSAPGSAQPLGLRLRPLDETLRDTVTWLRERGLLGEVDVGADGVAGEEGPPRRSASSRTGA